MLKCMRDMEPQRCVPHHKSLKVTRNATNRNKHLNEASKQTLPTISSKSYVITRKVCFPIGRIVAMSSIYDGVTKSFALCKNVMKLFRKRQVLTSQFDVSKPQKPFEV